MATRSYKVDDYDGETTEGVETVSFSLNGTSWVIDLAPANLALLEAALEPWMAKATQKGGPVRVATVNGAGVPDIRVWARAHGWPDLGDRGRVPAEAIAAYEAANPKR